MPGNWEYCFFLPPRGSAGNCGSNGEGSTVFGSTSNSVRGKSPKQLEDESVLGYRRNQQGEKERQERGREAKSLKNSGFG